MNKYLDLLKELDEEAYDYVLKFSEVPLEELDGYRKDLGHIFVWSDTPQGSGYWSALSYNLEILMEQ